MTKPESPAALEERKIDTLDVSPRFTEHDAMRLNRMFHGSSTQEMLKAVVEGLLAGDVATVSSFGGESVVLLHLLAEVDRNIPVLFLETGKHFAETIEYRDAVAERLGLRSLQILTPDEADIIAKDETGLRWSYDPDGCCEIRKVKPLGKALANFDASFTGRKSFQSSTRANLPRFELDNSDRLVSRGYRHLYARARSAPPPAGGARIPEHRLRTLHPQSGSWRRPSIRPLERLGQDRMRHPQTR